MLRFDVILELSNSFSKLIILTVELMIYFFLALVVFESLKECLLSCLVDKFIVIDLKLACWYVFTFSFCDFYDILIHYLSFFNNWLMFFILDLIGITVIDYIILTIF